MGARCSVLENFENACAIGECVESVEGFHVDSASPSDMYLLNLRDGVTFNKQPVRQVVAKVSVSPETMKKLKATLPLSEDGFNLLLTQFQAMEYEYLVYSNIIKPLLLNKVCPFFVNVYGVAYNCNYTNAERIVGKKRRKAFKQNIYTLISGGIRDSVTNPSIVIDKDLDQNFDPANKARFNMLFTEYMDPAHTKTFKSVSITPTPSEVLPAGLTQYHYTLLFQVAVACYAMELSKTNHNDLHHENVFVTIHDAPVTFYLRIDGIVYELVTSLVCKVFDYDHASSESLGTNSFYNEDEEMGTFQNHSDFIYFLGMYLDHLTDQGIDNEEDQQKLAALFSDESELQTKVLEQLKHGNYNQGSDASDAVTNWFDQLDDMTDVIFRLAQYAGIQTLPSAPSDRVWSLHADMFEDNGLLKSFSSPDESFLIYKIEKLNKQIEAARAQHAQLQAQLLELNVDL